jgi:hypothetical protein
MKLPFDKVEEIRQEHAAGNLSMKKLAKKYQLSYAYCVELLHGGARQTATPRQPMCTPVVSPLLDRITHPTGISFPRRSKRPFRFQRQIPYADVIRIRHEHQMNGTRPIDLSVMFGVSMSHIKRLLKRSTRKDG